MKTVFFLENRAKPIFVTKRAEYPSQRCKDLQDIAEAALNRLITPKPRGRVNDDCKKASDGSELLNNTMISELKQAFESVPINTVGDASGFKN